MIEILEDRTLLSLLPNNVENLKGLPVSAQQGVQINPTVATFTDTDSTAVASDFTATVNWGDSTSSVGTIAENASSVFSVTGVHTYTTTTGPFNIIVTIKDSNGTFYATNAFNQTNLVSSVAGNAGVTDANLINPWGMSSSASSPIWVSNQGSATSTLYNPNGTPIKQALTVTVPSAGVPSGPTGQVHNSDTTATDFTIPGPGSTTVPSIFLFANLNGTIAGWNPSSTGGTSSAVTIPTVSDGVLTGLAQASVTAGSTTTFYLYATDFSGTHGTNGIVVLDPTFTNVSGGVFAGKFADPNAVSGYLPYNITLLNGDLYVAYAQPSGIVTTGGGYIDEFDTSGNFINRVFTDTAGSDLKGPWGMAIAPSAFGSFGGDLLVGSFGDATGTSGNGTISAITLPTSPGTPGTFAGTLSTPNGTTSNAGLWGLLFGNGGSGGTSGTLYFSAGISGQTQGLFGSLAFSPAAAASVTASPISALGVPVSGYKGVALNPAAGGDVLVATFMDTGTPGAASDYTASINWGDGSTSSSTRITTQGTPNGVVFSVFGNHTYAMTGAFTVVTTITKTAGGSTAIASSAATIALQPPSLNSVTNLKGLAISAVQDVQTTQDVATFSSTGTAALPSDFTATINWGDGSSSNAGIITEDASNLFHVTGTHTYTKAGSFAPVVTIKDLYGTQYVTGALNQTNLVSSVNGMAAATDANLIDPWGMASSPTGPIWVADEGSGVSTIYNPNGTPIKQGLTVTIPTASGTGTGSPTGIVFNSDATAGDFPVSPGTSAVFLFDTLDGTIAAWASGSTAVKVATLAGGVFTGLTQGSVTTTTTPATTTYYLYAANFNPTSGTAGIVVFDPTFANVTGTTFSGKFVDPNAVSGYDPYNIALLNGNLYVTYAKPTGAAGTFTASDGYIDEFDTSGNFVNRIYTDTTGTNLNGPWGMVIAPSGFGAFGGDLLVGNFGDGTSTSPNGTIKAITLPTTPGTPGTLAGTLSTPNGVVDNAGQWGLLFGNGGSGGTSGTLYFSAGIDAQAQGLFGAISPAAAASVTVAAAPLSAQGATIRGIEGNALATTAGTADVLVATFMDTGTPGAASSYTATINWGDGTTSTAATRITSQGTPNGTVYSVFGNHTYSLIGTYPVTVSITNTANGAIGIANSQAVIADAALTPAPTQPTVDTTEDSVFSGAVASYVDANPSAPITDYTYVMIDWGDGTPQTTGTISQTGAAGTPFLVSGIHTYADAGVNGGTGHYPITVNVHDIDGSTTTITNTANVADVALLVTGKLDPASDSGASNADNITNVVQPTFLGTTSEPNATVTLYATAAGSSTPVLIGRGVSNADDGWSITSNQALADGSDLITAIAVDSSGHTTSTDTTIDSDLVIDNVGPKVTSVNFNRFQGQIQVTFQDFGGPNGAGVGLNMSTVIDANNYQLITVHHPRIGKYRFNVISDVPGSTSGTQTVTLSINGGKYVKGGWYFFTIRSVSPSNLTGIQDIAGNALDGEFYGYFPSGNNHPGGNFVAQLTAIHHTIYAPSTVIGRATPVSPPGTKEGNTIVPGTVNPSKFPRLSAARAREQAIRESSTKAVRHTLVSRVQRAAQSQIVGPTADLATNTPITTDLSPQALAIVDAALNQLQSHRTR